MGEVMNVQYEKIETKYKSPFRVLEIKVDNYKPVTVNKHWHRSLEFIIPTLNGTEVWAEGNLYHAHPDSMLLINSRYIHECASIRPELPYQGYAIQLKYDFIQSILPEIDQYEFDVFYDIESHPYLFKLMNKIIKYTQNNALYHYIKLQSLAYDLLYELVAHYTVAKHEVLISEVAKHKSRLTDVLTYLDQTASETFDACEVAEHFHLSYSHLAKLFKNEFGISMKEYVNSVRIRHASIDLLQTDLPIIDVALAHGFVSAKAFYKEFEKVYQMTPKQYRKTERHS